MRILDAATQAALNARRLVMRNLFWITAPRISDDIEESAGFWNDIGTQSFTVIDGQTGSNTTRSYTGSGTLISCDPIPHTSDLSVRRTRVMLSQTDDSLDAYVRAYNLKGAESEIHRELFSPDTRQVIAPGVPRSVAFVDGCNIETPVVNQAGGVHLDLASHTLALTRRSTQRRSHEDQLRRDPTDNGFKWAAVMSQVEQYWGEEKLTVSAATALTVSQAQQRKQSDFRLHGLL